MVVLARLAVDRSMQSHGIGRALVRDADLRVIQAAESIDIRGLIVQAISNDAKAFYECADFYPSPLNPMTHMITLTVRQTVL